jgi:hypothetical protein
MSTDDQYKNLKEPTPDSFPHFEEESWRKMEALLDKHLPEKKNRHFPFLLLFGSFILVCLTTFLPAKKQQTAVDIVTKSKASVLTVEPSPISEEIKEQQSPVTDDLINNSSTQHTQTTEITPGKEHRSQLRQTTLLLTSTEKRELKEKEFVNNTIPDVVFEELLLASTGRAVSFNKEVNLLLQTRKPVTNSSLNAPKEEIPAPKKPVKKSSLSLTFSTGLEAPGTAFNKWGRLTPLMGVGLQYSFGDKLILRTGVSTAAKIYTAQDKDYNPANNYWANYTYFKKIDADCKILEIPLSVAYRVVNSKKTSLYVSAGSSSYIMRKEAYNYYYKNQAGRDTITHRAWNNNSLHPFSSVNFSAIAERKLSNRFSLMAEPIIKIPTGGIGVGKIRLYNAGLTVTAKFKLR